MRGVAAHGHVVLERALDEVAGGQVVAAFGAQQVAVDRTVGDHEAHAQAGDEHLGEGAHVDDPAVGVEGLERGLGVSLVADVADVIVFQDRHVETAGQADQPPASLSVQAGARGVVEVGDGVDQARAVAGQDFLQLVHVHAVLVQPHRMDSQPPGPEHVQGPGIGRPLHDHARPGRRDQPGDQGQGLLGPGGDQDVVGPGLDALAGQHLGQGGAQGPEPGYLPVLHGRGPVPAHDPSQELAELVHGKKARVAGPAVQGDPVRPAADLRQIGVHGLVTAVMQPPLPGGPSSGAGRTAGLARGMRKHVETAALSGSDQALGQEFGVGALHRAPAHAQIRGQGADRGKPDAGPQVVGQDAVTKMGADLRVNGLGGITVKGQAHGGSPGKIGPVDLI